ncbi:MAG TPA: hypothetical protein VL172_00700, partial [Kofleriaceae bacterium]|nr:hypothetical protein [Kofleriaceae bacterium]
MALTAACGSAYADRVAEPAPEPAPMVAPAPQSPYKIELVSEDGRAMPVYQQGGRFYIMGTTGQRYTIHVTNPTARRVEAVLSVDG